MDSEALVAEIARFAADKKALDVVELDLRGVLGYTDYFLVCSGNTAPPGEGDPGRDPRGAQARARPRRRAASRARPTAAGS